MKYMCTLDFSNCSPINRDNERLGDRRKFEDKTSDLTFDKLFDKATNVFTNKKSDLNRKYSKISEKEIFFLAMFAVCTRV